MELSTVTKKVKKVELELHSFNSKSEPKHKKIINLKNALSNVKFTAQEIQEAKKSLSKIHI